MSACPLFCAHTQLNCHAPHSVAAIRCSATRYETQVHWNKQRTLRREVTFANNTDIQLALIEPLTGLTESVVPVHLSGRAVFSKWAITPAKGILFGPLTAGTASKPRTIEVWWWPRAHALHAV